MHCNYLPQDWQTRMDGGIAFYNGDPVIISSSGASITINSFPGGAKIKNIKNDDPFLDLSSPKLGWVNTPTNCFYPYRKPERKYKQTLTYGALNVFDPLAVNRVAVDALFYSDAFESMLRDKYPKLETVMAALNTKVGKVKSRAISRNVALAMDSFGIIRVYFKMEEVGYIKPGEKTVRVPKGNLSWVVSKYLEGFDWVID